MMKSATSYLLMVMLFLSSNLAFGQGKKSVSGTVRDASGTGLPGVSINEKGSKTSGTVTDNEGHFALEVGPNAVLVFTYVGFNSKEVSVGSNSTLSVELEEAKGSLSEVVVTGFGVRKQARKLSYSISEVKGDEIARASNANLVNALQGKVAGVFINQGNGGPMSSSRIRIRGNTSLTSNTQPLVVIDGVILEPGTTGGDSWGGAQDFGNQMKNLNPDDYESISVLKGSAASALYGSQAQNGVLLITTKKGKQQKGLGVTVSHSELYDKAFKGTEMQNEFGAGINPTFTNGTDGVPEVDAANFFWSFGPKFNGQQVRDIDDRMITWDAKPNNILDAFQVGKFINTNVAVQGGTEKTTFRASYSNLYNTYVIPNSNLKRNAFALRVTQKLSNFLTIDGSVNYSMSEAKNPMTQGSTGNPLFALAYFNPRNFDTKYWSENYLDPEGGVNRNDPYELSSLFYNMHYRNTVQMENTLLANVDLTAKITPWLNLLIRGNINNAGVDRETKNWGSGVGFAGGDYAVYNSTRRNTRLQALLTADKDLGDNFTISATLGGESQAYEPIRFSQSATSGGLKTPGGFFIGNSVNAASTNGGISNDGGFSKRIDAAYLFGDVTYRNMLTLNFSARNDWTSSLLYPNDGHGISNYFYPGAGLSWIFTETFKNSSTLNFLSFGKLRVAYAETGVGVQPWRTSTGYYSFLGNYNAANNVVIPRYGFDGGTLGNLNIKNELTKEFEVGADLRFFNNRLGVDFAFYKKNSYNQLLPLAVPSESGVSSQLVNAGNIQNQGIEILLTANPVKGKNFNWDFSVNYTRNRNKIIDLAPGVTSYNLDLAFGADMASVARPGKPYGTIITNYGYATYQAKDASGNDIAHASNGKKVLKQNGSFYRSSELGQPTKELGTMMENFLLNTSQNFRFKDFFLTFQVDGKFGGMMASATHQYGSTNGSLKSTLFGRSAEFGGLQRDVYTSGQVTASFDDGIIPDGVFGNGISITAPNGQVYDVSGMSYQEAVDQNIVEPISARLYYARLTQWSTGIREYSTFENSWVALREVSVGYTMPSRISSKLKLSSLRVSLIGRNLAYLYTTTKDGIHPEGGLLSNRAGTFAEYGGVPYIRSIGFKVDAGF